MKFKKSPKHHVLSLFPHSKFLYLGVTIIVLDINMKCYYIWFYIRMLSMSNYATLGYYLNWSFQTAMKKLQINVPF